MEKKVSKRGRKKKLTDGERILLEMELLRESPRSMPVRIALVGLKSLFLVLSILGMPYLVFWALNALQLVTIDYGWESLVGFWILVLFAKAYFR